VGWGGGGGGGGGGVGGWGKSALKKSSRGKTGSKGDKIGLRTVTYCSNHEKKYELKGQNTNSSNKRPLDYQRGQKLLSLQKGLAGRSDRSVCEEGDPTKEEGGERVIKITRKEKKKAIPIKRKKEKVQGGKRGHIDRES